MPTTQFIALDYKMISRINEVIALEFSVTQKTNRSAAEVTSNDEFRQLKKEERNEGLESWANDFYRSRRVSEIPARDHETH